MSSSPFTLDRFEHERIHLYYLPKDLFSLINEPKPIYLIGSRGTGKTTILNSLNWRERLTNDNLKESLNNNIFDTGLIGLYLKISNSHIKLIDRWLRKEEDELKEIVTGLYIDLLWLEELFIALAELTSEGQLKIIIEDEINLVGKLCEKYFSFSDQLKLQNPNSFISLSSFIAKLHDRIAKLALSEIDPKRIIDIFPMESPGSFGRKIAKEVCNICDLSTKKQGINWHIKVCFDESEVFSTHQRTTINSMIRLTESEVLFVVSYATEIDELHDTSIPNLSMSRADRTIIELNDLPDKGFRDFAEGVACVKINAKVSEKIEKFDLTKLLGRLSINKLLENELNNCENKKTQQYWLDRAKSLKNTSFYNEVITKKQNELPIYQAYLIEKRNISLPSPDDPNWKFRHQESAEIRKRMVAAFLCLCSELNHKVPYAYDKMVLQMSDSCIRDYLLQMHCIFKETQKSLDKFIRIENLSTKIQTEALRKASFQKMDSIGESKIKSPKEVQKIVDGLAKITSSLQKNADSKSLASNEKGKFVLNTSESISINRDRILDVINQAYEGGYLKMLKGQGKDWKFQIHTSLAPAYELSYRGAQYETRISMVDLWELIQSNDEEEHKGVIKKLLHKYNPKDPKAESPQLELF